MKKIYILFLPLVFLMSCVKSLDDYNTDVKKPSSASATGLFANATLRLTSALTSPSVNSNVFRFFVQHWTTTTYLDEPRYNLTARTIPLALWQSVYRDALSDYTAAKTNLEADVLMDQNVKKNQIAMIEVMEVYAWSILVTTYGDVPYSEALDITNTKPVYDDQAAIYTDLMARLNVAIGQLDAAHDGFEAGDRIYGGDTGSWILFANSLKLKLGLILSDVNPTVARTAVSEAASNVIANNTQNAMFRYENATPNNNPLSDNLNPLLTSRKDYLSANTLVDKMNALNDPRREAYFVPLNGAYIGGIYGFNNTYANFSPINPAIYALDAPAALMDHSEVEFYLAEAVERGFITGSAAEHYTKGIVASMAFWKGITEDQALASTDVIAYLARPDVLYATATGNYKQKIGTQAWIALFNRGHEAWTEWRRLDYPVLNPPTGGNAPAGLKIPVRLIYPPTESSLNSNYAAAAAKMGGDVVTFKLFWDVN